MPSSLIGEPSLTAAAAHQLLMRQRRQALVWLAGGAMAPPAASRAATGSCVAMPSEMAGPFPGDGANRFSRRQT